MEPTPIDMSRMSSSVKPVAPAPAPAPGPETKSSGQAAERPTQTSTTTGTSSRSSNRDSFITEPTDEEVMAYLRHRGMSSAALELSRKLKQEAGIKATTNREKMEAEDAEARVQRSLLARSTGGGFGYDTDAGAYIPQWGVPDVHIEKTLTDKMGQEEARSLVGAFVALQTWVLSLPDDPAQKYPPSKHSVADADTRISISSIAKKRGEDMPDDIRKDAELLSTEDTFPRSLPPSTKPELLAVTFALLVHTHCELLEVGMESTAASVLNTFRSIYDPVYATELADLDKCRRTEDIVRLNSHISTHLEALNHLKAIMVRVADFQLNKEKLIHDTSDAHPGSYKSRKIAEYDQHIATLNQRYDDDAKTATEAFRKMKDFPFLRRARAVKWQISLSASSYALLASFLSSREMLLPVNALLLKQCELHVERRDPLPYMPACILDDNSYPARKKSKYEAEINWAAPVPPAARLAESGEETSNPADLPFPPIHLEKEYRSEFDADRAKRKVEFNRALLKNGFRRLEALERKMDYEAGIRKEEDKSKDNPMVNPLEPSILLSTLCSSSSPGPHLAMGRAVDASSIWEESGVGLTSAKICPPDGRRVAAGCDDSAVRVWSLFGGSDEVKEAGIVLLGHKNGFPVFDVDWSRDGRTLLSAGGDGSVRLWDTMVKGPFGSVATLTNSGRRASSATKSDKNQQEHESEDAQPGMPVPGQKPETTERIGGAALAVYRGHSASCPVWSVAFAPSGYYFASAASDGTGRIFTTDRPIPVRVLSGHTNASVNNICWHPNCNYVLTGCDDKTVRMWDVQTGRSVRLLNGSSYGISVVRVSPSGKYAAGSDYKGIVHLWDLGTGKKINEFRPHGLTDPDPLGVASRAIHALSFSACGTALATGGDDCVVRIWDIRGAGNHMSNPEFAKQQGWGEGLGAPTMVDNKNRPGTMQPHKVFPTRRTVLLDLQYTKQNLLLSVGKYTTAVPLVNPIVD